MYIFEKAGTRICGQHIFNFVFSTQWSLSSCTDYLHNYSPQQPMMGFSGPSKHYYCLHLYQAVVLLTITKKPLSNIIICLTYWIW